jgi:hypothetical protein
MKGIYDLVMWISSILPDSYAVYDKDNDEIVIRDLKDDDDIYWFSLDDFEL